MVAMLSAENMRRPSSCQCSCCSSNTAPTRRVMAASLGKMPTTRVRRLLNWIGPAHLSVRPSRALAGWCSRSCASDPWGSAGRPARPPWHRASAQRLWGSARPARWPDHPSVTRSPQRFPGRTPTAARL
jgi:hypothetical protein